VIQQFLKILYVAALIVLIAITCFSMKIQNGRCTVGAVCALDVLSALSSNKTINPSRSNIDSYYIYRKLFNSKSLWVFLTMGNYWFHIILREKTTIIILTKVTSKAS